MQAGNSGGKCKKRSGERHHKTHPAQGTARALPDGGRGMRGSDGLAPSMDGVAMWDNFSAPVAEMERQADS